MMLFETMQSLVTPCSSALRRMGYLHESIALQARAHRCRSVWEEHTRRCRALILRAAAACPKRREVVILGSGVLSDVPLPQLSNCFERVHLVDIIHLPAVRRKARRLPNVELHRYDLSGVVHSLISRRIGEPLPHPVPEGQALLKNGRIDLVVSLNTLSQLPVYPVRFAYDHLGYSDHQAILLGQSIIQAHLGQLNSIQSKAKVHTEDQTRTKICLISDVEAHHFSPQGDLEIRDDLLFNETLADPEYSWNWWVAPPGELPKGSHASHIVHAWTDF